MSKPFLQAIVNRRTYYGISNEKIVAEPMIVEIVETALKHSPSAFNSQNSRVLVLFGAEHAAFWAIAMAALRALVPVEKFTPTEEKINAFAAGYGTVLFFEDMAVVEGMQKQFPAYAANFPIWSGQASGMLQLVVWTALEAEGLGASLQHYSPVVDEGVYGRWSVPRNWKLTAQMPFGKPTAQPGEKEFSSITERLKVYR
ncbi:MAG: nitroreductase family protein [Negativicutes bacterium]|jgi:hypothetical protein